MTTRLLTVLALLASSATTFAQPAAEWLVVSASVDGSSPTEGATGSVRATLAASDPDGLATQIDATLGTAPIAVTSDDIEALRQEDESIMVAVASGYDDDAIENSTLVLDRVEPELARYGRRTDASKHISNICLYGVRARLHRGDDTNDVNSAVSRCLRITPDLVADRMIHPPVVIEAVGRVRARLEQSAPSLSIHAPAEGCAVRVNGRRVGETPEVALHLPAGAVAVQVECTSDAGREQRETIPARVEVDVDLLRAIRTDGSARLVYPNAAAFRRLAPRHAERLGAITGSRQVAIVASYDELVHIVSAEHTATVPSNDAGAITRAANAIGGGESLDESQRFVTTAPNRLRGPALGAFILSGLSLIAGGIFGGLALKKYNDRQALPCADGRTCSDEQVSGLGTFTLLTDITLGLSLAAFATGLTLWLLGRRSNSEQQVALTPWADQTATGLSLRGNF